MVAMYLNLELLLATMMKWTQEIMWKVDKILKSTVQNRQTSDV